MLSTGSDLCRRTPFLGIGRTNKCNSGSNCEGFSIDGSYSVCENKNNGTPYLKVDIDFQLSQSFMLGDDNNSISVGWGMDYGTTNEASGAYRAKFNPRDPSQEM